MGIQNKKIFASILFVLISFVCVAQDPPGPGDPVPPPPPGLPIDGAIPLAIIGALYLGIKNKRSQDQDLNS